MATTLAGAGCKLHVDRSPEWWFIRITANQGETSSDASFVDDLWQAAAGHNVIRFVVEVSEDVMLTSLLVGQLVQLHKRAHLENGVLRICGWTEKHYETLRLLQLADRFPNYDNRESAVIGRLPEQADR